MMGMNVVFRYATKKEHKPFPVDKDTGKQYDWKHCLPRYTDSWDFMSAMYADEIISLKDCLCGDKHQYMCQRETAHRPLNFVAFKERTKHLQPVWQDVIQYLEDEPDAYIEYY